MKFGHHGGNHPVKDVEKNVVMITARTTVLRWMKQHYLQTCVSRINPCSTVRYRAFIAPINRRSASRVTLKPALVHDAAPLFDHFIELIEQYRKTAK